MKLLVLGGAGFIGTNLCSRISKKNNVLVFDSLQMGNNLSLAKIDCKIIVDNILNLDKLTEVVSCFKPDRIFHLAANSDISESAKNAQIDIDNTFLTTYNLVQACLLANLKPQVVFASSSAVYGNCNDPITEQTIKSPISSYGWMKLLSEEILTKALIEKRISMLTIVRFPNVTGSWQTHGVVKDLVAKLRRNNFQLEILGNGNQRKPYVLVDELCRGILNLVETQSKPFEEVNLAPNDLMSVKEIVDMLIKYSNLKPNLVYGETPYGWVGDVPKYSYDTSYATSILGSNIFSTSRSAIANSIDWEWKYRSE